MKLLKRVGALLFALCLVFQMLGMPVMAASPKGLQVQNGKTCYYNSKGKKVKNKLVKVKKYYYYFGKNGVAVKGLKKVGKAYCYFDKKYHCVQNKVVKIKGKKYYFSKNGKAVSGAVKAGGKIWVSSAKGLLKKNITGYAKVGDDFDIFLKAAGKPKKSEWMDSCYDNKIAGKDGIYTYSNFTVYTFEADGSKIITYVQ